MDNCIKKVMYFSVLVLFSGSHLLAQAPVVKAKNMQSIEQARSNFLAKTGGVIYPVEKGQGSRIKIISLQPRITVPNLARITQAMRDTLHLPIVIEAKTNDQAVTPQAVAVCDLKGTNVAVVIVVYDMPHQPTLLLAPEEKWALVNVSPLAEGVSSDVLYSRLEKELWRALGYVMGAGNTSVETCVLKPVFKREDLDKIKGRTIAPLAQASIFGSAAVLGLQRVRPVPYRKACEEGWAPAPTNQFQKAIWEEIHVKEKK